MTNGDIPPPGITEARREVLRQAGVALEGRVVTLWEIALHGEPIPVATSGRERTVNDAIGLDLERMLHGWDLAPAQGSRWVGCRLDGGDRWCVAPVRAQPPAPPPQGVERRSRERITLELAGLSLGLLDRPSEDATARMNQAAATRELALDPAIIAHEVANPLTAAMAAVESCVETAREGTLDQTLRERLLEDLADAGGSLEQAAKYLRAVRRRAQGDVVRGERFDAVQALRTCLAVERPLARKHGVNLEWHSSVESAELRRDSNALCQILTNLLRNAVDASRGREQAAVRVDVDRTGDVLRIEVRDTGEGIEPERLSRVFERGFTTKAPGSGSGLGLTVVRELTERVFGGKVTLESQPGIGTLATVTLPVPPVGDATADEADGG